MTSTIRTTNPHDSKGTSGSTRMSTRPTRRSVLAAAVVSAAGAVSFFGVHRSASAIQATPGASNDSAREIIRVPRDPDYADLPYVDDGDPRHTLDIYLPSDDTGVPSPVIVWIHGGAYVTGSKENVGIPYLLDDGHAIVSINYRLLQDARFPAQIVDGNAAISWVWQHADEYGFDRDRLVVGGASAGGTSSVLVAVSQNDAVPQFKADPEIRIAALLDFFGSTTEEQLKRKRRNLDATDYPTSREGRALLDAIQFVDADDPPSLIIHGGLDETVAIEQSEKLAAALERADVPVTFSRYPGLGHGVWNFQSDDVQDTVRTFLSVTLN